MNKIFIKNIKNRICPDEIILSEYFEHKLDDDMTREVEHHLASCSHCRALLADTYKILGAARRRCDIFGNINGKIWLILAFISFLLSFIVKPYFQQFLTAALLLGLRWVVSAKLLRYEIYIEKKNKKNIHYK